MRKSLWAKVKLREERAARAAGHSDLGVREVTLESLEEREKRLEEKAEVRDNKSYPRGGNGGTAQIVDGEGVAVGGNGGRGGALRYGRGGDGGSGTARDAGAAYARGGDGGDAGRPVRPALGGASPLAHLDGLPLVPGLTDAYGIPQPGKGGDSHMAYVRHDGREYCMNILLQLIRGPMPKIIEKPEIIDVIDAEGAKSGIKSEQEWWDLAVDKFPSETTKIMEHMRICEGK